MVSVLLESRGLVFLHVPKTAGGSISRALRHEPDAIVYSVENMERAEPCAQQMQRRLPKSLSAYETLAVVRNPWDWTVSGYLHVTENAPAYGSPPSFEEFALGAWQNATENHYPEKFKTATAYVAYHTQITQWEHLSINGTRLEVNHLCRFESLETDLFKAVGHKIQLPHVNKSDRLSYAAYYNEATKLLVEERNAPLIEHFGYRFAGG